MGIWCKVSANWSSSLFHYFITLYSYIPSIPCKFICKMLLSMLANRRMKILCREQSSILDRSLLVLLDQCTGYLSVVAQLYICHYNFLFIHPLWIVYIFPFRRWLFNMLSVSFVFVVVVVFVVVATPKVVNLAETGSLSIGLSFSCHRCYIYLAIFVYMYSLAVGIDDVQSKMAA